MIKKQLVRKRRIKAGVQTTVEQFRAQLGVPGDTGFGNSQPLFNRTVIVIGPSDAEGWHMIKKEIRPVLYGDRDQGIGLRGGEHLAQFAVTAKESSACSLGAASVHAVIPGAWLAAQA